MNLQMFKLDLEKAEEPEIQLPTSTGSLKNQESSRETSTSALLTITSWQIYRETMQTVTDFILGGTKITADGDCSHEIKKMLAPCNKSYDQSRQHIKKQRHYFANKSPSSQNYGFSSSHVWM